MESYESCTQADAQSAADKFALSILNSELFQYGERYTVPILCVDNKPTYY